MGPARKKADGLLPKKLRVDMRRRPCVVVLWYYNGRWRLTTLTWLVMQWPYWRLAGIGDDGLMKTAGWYWPLAKRTVLLQYPLKTDWRNDMTPAWRRRMCSEERRNDTVDGQWPDVLLQLWLLLKAVWRIVCSLTMTINTALNLIIGSYY